LPYVTSPGSSKSDGVVRSGGARVAVATAWGALALAVAVISSRLPAARALSIAAALAAAWLLLGRVFQRRLGGVTGDFLGATVQIGEIVTLAVLAWRW
jgi:adenosylcobinamide-GDP ribazoletransferase